MKLRQWHPELLERVFCVIERAAEMADGSPMADERQPAATVADENEEIKPAREAPNASK